MLNFNIFETETFTRDFHKTLGHKAFLVHEILFSKVYPQLKAHPYHGTNIKKLKGYKEETWRYRVGNYRLFYRINLEQKTVSIVTVEHRKDAY